MEIGAQLFATREYCKDLQGFTDTLKKVADIGCHIREGEHCFSRCDWLKYIEYLKYNRGD